MEVQAAAAVLPVVCMEILRGIAALKSRVADMALYEPLIMSVLTVLENANQNQFVLPNMIASIATSLEDLRGELEQARVMSRCCYMGQAKDCLKRMDRKVILVLVQVSCYNALMMTRQNAGGLSQEVRDALENIRQEINHLRNVVPPTETANDQLVRAELVPIEIVELSNQLQSVWSHVTERQMEQLKQHCNVLMPLLHVNPLQDPRQRIPRWTKVSLFLLLLAGSGCAIYIFLRRSEEETIKDSSKTLSAILNRGYLVCGVAFQEGFATISDKGSWVGFEVDLCRAVAAGIFGKDRFLVSREKEPVRFVPLEAGERFISLDNKEIDVLLGMSSHTLERTLVEASHLLNNCVGF